jgi:hypothetical protein
VASLACGASEPTCSSWTFDSATVEGWKKGTYYTAASQGMTTDLSTVVNNGSRVLMVKFNNPADSGKWAAEFSVNLCPDAGMIDMSNYVFKYELYLRTTSGHGFAAGEGADTFLASSNAVILACQGSFLQPASDKWEPGSCANLPASMKDITLIVRLPTWTGDVYLENPRFELEPPQ